MTSNPVRCFRNSKTKRAFTSAKLSALFVEVRELFPLHLLVFGVYIQCFMWGMAKGKERPPFLTENPIFSVATVSDITSVS